MCTAHRVAKEHMCLQAGRVDDAIGKPWLSIPTTSAHHERSVRGGTEWVLCSRRKRRMEEMAMLSDNARWELLGTRYATTQVEKRYPVTRCMVE